MMQGIKYIQIQKHCKHTFIMFVKIGSIKFDCANHIVYGNEYFALFHMILTDVLYVHTYYFTNLTSLSLISYYDTLNSVDCVT